MSLHNCSSLKCTALPDVIVILILVCSSSPWIGLGFPDKASTLKLAPAQSTRGPFGNGLESPPCQRSPFTRYTRPEFLLIGCRERRTLANRCSFVTDGSLRECPERRKMDMDSGGRATSRLCGGNSWALGHCGRCREPSGCKQRGPYFARRVNPKCATSNQHGGSENTKTWDAGLAQFPKSFLVY